MLVALNPRRPFPLLFAVLAVLSSGQTITQLNSLANMRVSQSEVLYLDLYNMISGPNLTFSISGSYSPSLPASDVKIYQNFNLTFSSKKTVTTNQQQSYGGLQIDYYRKYLYTIDNNYINVWSLSEFPSLNKLASYQVKVEPSYYVISMQLINFRVVNGKPLQRFAFTVEFRGATYIMRVLNFTDITKPAEIADMQIFRQIPNFSRANFYQDSNYVWGFLYSSSEILLFRFDLIAQSSTYMYSISQSTLNATALAPISISFFGGNGYYCDENIGVFQVSLEYLNSTSANFPVTQSLRAPSNLGVLVSCTINRGILTVDTEQGTALYSLPSFQQLIAYPHDTYTTDDNYGMTTNGELTVGWVDTVLSSSSVRTSFRIYSNQQSFLNSLLIDVDATVFLNGDNSNMDPAFVLYQPITSQETYVIINAAKTLLVYKIEKGSFLEFPAQNVPYTYTGTLVAFDGTNSKSFPVSLQGVSGNSTEIFTGRGNYDGDDYPHPSSFASYILTVNNSVFTSYIPVCNYFDGPNLTYELTVKKGTKNFDTLEIYTPSKWSQASVINAEKNVDLSSFQIFQLGLGNDLVINLNEDFLLVYFFQDLEEKSTFSYDFPSNWTTSLVAAEDVGDVFIIVESTGYDQSLIFYVQWSVFKYSSGKTNLVTNNIIPNREPSSQILLDSHGLFYSLSGNSIDIFELDESTGKLTGVSSINQDTISTTIDFTPVSFGIFDKFYVFDYYLGLIYLEEVNGTSQYRYTSSNLVFPQSFDVVINGDIDYIYITIRTFNLSNIYLVPDSLLYYDILPLVHCDIPSGFSISELYYSQVCITGGMFYIQIFDAYESLFAALYTEIYPGMTGFFGLGSRVNYNSVAGYYTDGTRMIAYTIGQNGNSSFDPTYPTEVQPGDDLSQTIWSQVKLTFNDIYFESQYKFELNLRAYNNYHSVETTLSYTLYNSRNFIEMNQNYNNSDSNFTSGYINLAKDDFVSVIPTNAFSGNNIEFAFQVNSSMDNIKKATEFCNNKESFCLENKTYPVTEQLGEFRYFDHYDDKVVATNSTHVLFYSLIINTQSYTMSSFRLNWAVPTTVIGDNTVCYQVVHLQGPNAYALACTSILERGTFYFIAILGANQQLCSSLYYISYPVQFLRSSYDNGVTWIFFFESVQITIIQLVNSTSSQTCGFTFTDIGHISQNSLYTNTPPFSFVASSFKPIDMYYFTINTMLIIDEDLGLVFIEQYKGKAPYTYRLGFILTPTTNILQVQNSKVISSALDKTGQETVLLIMNTADVYKCAIYPYPRVISHFPKIFETGFVPANKMADVIPESTTLVFPVIKGDSGYLRFLNYSSDATSAIYKDRLFGLFDNNTYNQRVMASKTQAGMILHNFNEISILESGGPLHVFGFRANPLGYVRKSSKAYNGTLALVGFIGSEYNQYIPVKYLYPKTQANDKSSSSNSFGVHTYRSRWNRWYFWFIFSTFAIVAVASSISVYVCISKRRTRAYSQSIGLTTVNP
jgi:hypothetical protein